MGASGEAAIGRFGSRHDNPHIPIAWSRPEHYRDRGGPALHHAVGAWTDLFESAGRDTSAIARIAEHAEQNGTSFHEELACSRRDVQDHFHQILASELGIRYCGVVDPERLVIRDADLIAAIQFRTGPRIAFYRRSGAENAVLLSPAHLDLAALRGYLERYPAITARLMIVAPSALRKALIERARHQLAQSATSRLFDRWPQFSARIVANAVQGFGLGLLITMTITGIFLYPLQLLVLFHCLFSVCFLSCVLLRAVAAIRARPPSVGDNVDHTPCDLPVYSILVPLYREADIAPDLLAALEKIEWPRSKLDILLILEEDDLETLEAVSGLAPDAHIEILTVPNLGPRTKPKALAFAMPVISGEFVAVYDAEDQPHPGQLAEAWNKFHQGGARLACVQAPLHIRNSGTNPLTRLFAFEYAALFRGLLPELARRRLFFPLGGTSNHFRVSVLRKICDWDPFNVTEDADLAVRLCRFGYRLDMIDRPTLEDAPERFTVWIRQRSRWFKGWMQTFLVHARNPATAMRQLGFKSYIVSQILLFGIVVSSLSYIFIIAVIASLIYKILRFSTLDTLEYMLLFVDVSNVLLGISAFLVLGWKTLTAAERKELRLVPILTPAYWLMMSIAAWRAVWQLYRQPFLWEKTPHSRFVGIRSSRATGADRYDARPVRSPFPGDPKPNR